MPFHTYAVVKGIDPIREAQMAAEVIGAGARSIFLDLEPCPGYWQGTPEGALAFGAELRRLQPGATIITAIDPRPWALGGIPLGSSPPSATRWRRSSTGRRSIRRATRDGYAQSGFPPPAEGVTPEFLLDVTLAATLAIRPPDPACGPGSVRFTALGALY